MIEIVERTTIYPPQDSLADLSVLLLAEEVEALRYNHAPHSTSDFPHRAGKLARPPLDP